MNKRLNLLIGFLIFAITMIGAQVPAAPEAAPASGAAENNAGSPALPDSGQPAPAASAAAETTPAAETAPAAEPALNPIDEQRLRIIRFGTDTEIANLIKILRNEQPSSPVRPAAPSAADSAEPAEMPAPLSRIESELLLVAQNTKNRAILTGVFGYFGDREISGLEERAKTAIAERDYEAGDTVNAALLYLGNIKAVGVREALTDILDGEESRFVSGAIRALGKTAEKDSPEETAAYFIDFYTNRESDDENKRLIAAALGDIKSQSATEFLSDIAENEDEKTPIRMTALESLGKIADPAGLDAIVAAASSKDPNVRSSAVGSLGPFSEKAADDTIIEAFRDSYYRTRLAAARASGERKLTAAVPYLRFRIENDEVMAVRDEAVKAMGLIGGGESENVLGDLFKERKNSDRVRINAGEMLLAHGNADYVSNVIVEMEDAKARKQTPLYNGFLRILGGATSPKLEDFARRLFANGGVIEKSYALDICLNNNFTVLSDEVRKLTDPKNGSLSGKSQRLLEKWGLPLTAPAVPPAEASAASTAEPPVSEPAVPGAAAPAAAEPPVPAENAPAQDAAAPSEG